MKINRLGWGVGLLAILLVAFAGLTAFAYTPAGTQITNQAVAKYTDTNNIERTANSNIVYVTVAQIAGVEVAPSSPATVDVLANQTVTYSFSVTNTGNGPDTFSLDLVSLLDADQLNPVSLELYRDINGNGIIDAGDTVVPSVGPIPAGDTAHLIARFRVPSDAVGTDEIQIQLTATSGHSPSESANSAIVTFNVVTEGVLSSTLQAQSDYVANRSLVEPGGTITYTITSLNQGMQAIADQAAQVTITIPAGFTFVENSLIVNGVVQDDLAGSGEHTILLPTINGGQAAEVKYTVQVPGNQPVGDIINQVKVQVGSGTEATTNAVQTRVLQVADVTLSQAGEPGSHTIAEAEIGKTYEFSYTVTNSGNGPDQIFIDVTNGKNWPLAVYAPDGVTELAKQNGQYTVGIVSAGENSSFIVKVTVPTSEASSVDPNIVTVTATSQAGGSDTKTSTLESVKGAGVSIVKPDPDSGEPGDVVEYEVEITNDGPATDLFDLSLVDVPEGYVVEFFDEDGNPISNISIDGGDTETITVRVTIPSDATPTQEQFEVIVTSQNNSNVTGTAEIEIEVDAVVAIEVAPNRNAAANRGSFTTSTVTLTNLGNDTVTVDLTTAGGARLEYVFLDPATDSVIGETNEGVALGVGESVDVKIRIDVPSQVAVGTIEVVRIVATVQGAGDVSDFATVTTEVLGGQLQLLKGADVTTAKPGEFIKYEITAKNISVGQLTDVIIQEAVPEFTEFVSATEDPAAGMTIEYSADNGTNWDADPAEDTITTVRWILDQPLEADADVTVTITVKVK